MSGRPIASWIAGHVVSPAPQTVQCGQRHAPAGWWCTRFANHDGPCAAHQIGASLETTPLDAQAAREAQALIDARRKHASGSQGNGAQTTGPVADSPPPPSADVSGGVPAPTLSRELCSITSMSRLLRLFDALYAVSALHGAGCASLTVFAERVTLAEEVARLWAGLRGLTVESFEGVDLAGSPRRTLCIVSGKSDLFRVSFRTHAERSTELRDAELENARTRGRK